MGTTEVEQRSLHFLDCGELRRFVPHNTALTDEFSSCFELRLHQDHYLPASPFVRSLRKCGVHNPRKNECRGDKRDIHYDEFHVLANHFSRHIPGIRLFQQAHAGILTQFEIQLAVSGVDRNHPADAALQQAIGKSAGGSADIETDLMLNVDGPIFESAFKLKTAATDVLQIFAEQA